MEKIDIACIVDDDPIFVFATKKVMQMARFCKSFLVFRNGKEALDSLVSIVNSGTVLPDIILLDLNMPVMDGWQFLDEFIKMDLPRKITIYVVSSSIDPNDIKRAERYKEVENYLIKPVTEKTLQGILAGLDGKL
jgi:CheY-like chemotaxis protein